MTRFAGTKRAALFGILALTAPLLASCASNDDLDLSAYVQETEPADVLYNQGLANLNAGKITEASRKFDAVIRFLEY